MIIKEEIFRTGNPIVLTFSHDFALSVSVLVAICLLQDIMNPAIQVYYI